MVVVVTFECYFFVDLSVLSFLYLFLSFSWWRILRLCTRSWPWWWKIQRWRSFGFCSSVWWFVSLNTFLIFVSIVVLGLFVFFLLKDFSSLQREAALEDKKSGVPCTPLHSSASWQRKLHLQTTMAKGKERLTSSHASIVS